MAQDSTIGPAFRPQTMTAAMQLLRFVLNEGGYITKTSVLNPLDHLDVPTSVVIRWGIVPQWTWSVWLEYHSLHADTIMYLVSPFLYESEHVLGLQTTTYIRHHSAGPGPVLEVPELISTNSRSSDQAAMISVTIVRRYNMHLGMPLTFSRISFFGSIRCSPLACILSNSQQA